MREKLAPFFISSAAVILLATGAAKIFSALTGGSILQSYDPIFAIKLRGLFWSAGAIEVFVGLVCLFSQRMGLQGGLVLWLGGMFLAYRIGLIWIGTAKPCGCLGTLTGALNIPTDAADFVMKLVLAYLLIGSSATLFWVYRRGGTDKRQKALSEAG